MRAANLCILLVLAPRLALAQNAQAGSLTGVRTVGVLVELLDEESRDVGLTRAQIATAVALKLREHGVTVLDNIYAADGTVYANITMTRPNDDRDVGVNVAIKFYQDANLMRPPHRYVPWATTWDAGRTMVVGTGRARASVRSAVSDLMDSFVNDWLSVNH